MRAIQHVHSHPLTFESPCLSLILPATCVDMVVGQ